MVTGQAAEVGQPAKAALDHPVMRRSTQPFPASGSLTPIRSMSAP